MYRLSVYSGYTYLHTFRLVRQIFLARMTCRRYLRLGGIIFSRGQVCVCVRARVRVLLAWVASIFQPKKFSRLEKIPFPPNKISRQKYLACAVGKNLHTGNFQLDIYNLAGAGSFFRRDHFFGGKMADPARVRVCLHSHVWAGVHRPAI